MCRKCALLLVCALSAVAQNRFYRSVTIIGGGLPENVSGTSAVLGTSQISGLAADGAGNVYISSPDYAVVLKLDPNGYLTRVAGTGLTGFGGDGGPATAAQLNAPGNLALGPNGDLYIVDQGNLRVRKVSGGTITTVAGSGKLGSIGGDNGPATAAAFESLEGIAVDAAGNLYLAEWANSCVRKVSAGIITTAAGTCGNPMLLDEPKGIAVDTAGNLFISHAFGVEKVAPGGTVTSVSAQQWPQLALDPAGNLYMSATRYIYKISNGTTAAIAGDGTEFGFSGDNGPALSAALGYPEAIAVDPAGNVYIADTINRRIRKISNGIITTVAGGGAMPVTGPAAGFQLYLPSAVVPDGHGGLYVADQGNNRVLRISNGAVGLVAGTGQRAYSGDNGPATQAGLYSPNALAVDASGNLYIADYNNGAVREVSGGIVTTVVSNIVPAGIAVDSAGNLYVSTGKFCAVWKYINGQRTVVAGNGTPFYTGDNGPAVSAGLDIPTSLFIDQHDNLYIVEQYGGRIRKVSGGIITTVAGSNAYGPSEGSGPYPEPPFYQPDAVAVDAEGNVFVSTPGNLISTPGSVLEVTPGGIATIYKGTRPYTEVQDTVSIFPSMGLAVDPDGAIYVADYGNQRILALLPEQQLCRVALCSVSSVTGR